MASGKFGPSSVTVTIEDAPGGSAQNIENFLLDGISAKVLSEMIETTALGDSWKERVPLGMRDSDPITLSGIWDTTATTGTHAVLGTVEDGPQDDGRQLVIVFGDSKTFTRDVLISEYEVIASTTDITKFSCVLTPTGAAVWTP